MLAPSEKPRTCPALRWSLVIALALTLGVAWFTYEFSIPARGSGGVALCAWPRWGTQVLRAEPPWSVANDEWGGALAHARSLLVETLLPALGAVMALWWMPRRRQLRRRATLAVAGMCVAVLIMRWGSMGVANYIEECFGVKPAFLPPHEEILLTEHCTFPAGTIRVSRAGFELREQVAAGASSATILLLGLIALLGCGGQGMQYVRARSVVWKILSALRGTRPS